ncbi:hypothetical protein GCM10027615_36940 [Plantactinospora veratri]
MVEKVASATALSKHDPTRPIDWRTFHRAQARAKSAEQYSLPLALWKITPSTLPPRVTAAMFSAAMTSPASWWAPGDA